MRVLLGGRVKKLMETTRPKPEYVEIMAHVWRALEELRRIPRVPKSLSPGEMRTFWCTTSGRDVQIKLEIVDSTTVNAYDFHVC